MTVHQAGRLGFVSFLYENKARIAYSIGLITELPIALCSSDYTADQSLVIFAAEDSESVPPLAIQTRDLNPFIFSLFVLPAPARSLLCSDLFVPDSGNILPGAVQALFRPPSIG
jgi:hypothetical protein